MLTEYLLLGLGVNTAIYIYLMEAFRNSKETPMFAMLNENKISTYAFMNLFRGFMFKASIVISLLAVALIIKGVLFA